MWGQPPLRLRSGRLPAVLSSEARLPFARHLFREAFGPSARGQPMAAVPDMGLMKVLR